MWQLTKVNNRLYTKKHFLQGAKFTVLVIAKFCLNKILLTLKPAKKRKELANGVKAYLVFFCTKNLSKYAEIVHVGISAKGSPDVIDK